MTGKDWLLQWINEERSGQVGTPPHTILPVATVTSASKAAIPFIPCYSINLMHNLASICPGSTDEISSTLIHVC